METKELQNEINDLLAKLGWSKNKAAKIIFMEQNESDDDEEHIKRFQRSFVKDLSRDTIKPKKLAEYLRILFMQKEVKKLGLILPNYQKTGFLSSFMEDEMLKISKEINKIVE